MSDPEATAPPVKPSKWKRAYVAAEEVFDVFLGFLTASHWSLAIFVLWTLIAVGFGWWVGK